MKDDKTSNLPGQKYLEYQLSLFGHRYNKENDLSFNDKDEKRKQIIKFLDLYVDKKLFTKGEQDEFSKNFTKMHDRLYQRLDKNNGRIYGVNKIKKCLEEYNMKYTIDHKQASGDKKTYWEVKKINLQSNEER